jgi:competence protein ComGC
MANLISDGYLTEDTGCPNGTKDVKIDLEGNVTAVAKSST